MGHLDNRKTIIEARLTAEGREALAREGELNITQFAVADDEVDYGLWQEQEDDEVAGDIIENLPLFEAFADERQSMRFRLIALENEIDMVPVVNLPAGESSLSLDEGDVRTFSPTTELNNDETNLDNELGYTAIIEDSDFAIIEPTEDGKIDFDEATFPVYLSDRDQTQTEFAIGTEFRIEWAAESIDPSDFEDDPDCPTDGPRTRIIIIGNETGIAEEVDLVVSVS